MRLPRSRGFFLTLAGAALAIVLLANAHLIYVASTSQPECVPHAQSNDAQASPPGMFRAAKSSC